MTIKYEYVVGVSVWKDSLEVYELWGPHICVTEMRNSPGSFWFETGAVNSEIRGLQIYQKPRKPQNYGSQ